MRNLSKTNWKRARIIGVYYILRLVYGFRCGKNRLEKEILYLTASVFPNFSFKWYIYLYGNTYVYRRSMKTLETRAVFTLRRN